MSLKIPRVKESDPVLYAIVDKLRARIGNLQAVWIELGLDGCGISYNNLTSYMRGRTRIPGWLLGRLITHVSWDWAWGLATYERSELGARVCFDLGTSTFDRLRSLGLYLGSFRETSDRKSHASLVSDLLDAFSFVEFPLEYVFIRHEVLIMRGMADGRPSAREDVVQNWNELWLLYLKAEAAVGTDVELMVGICRDRAMKCALRLPISGHIPAPLLCEARDSRTCLLACDELVVGPTMRGFHYYSLTHVEACLGQFDLATAALAELRKVCEEGGPEGHPDAAGIWWRYHMAEAFLLGRLGKSKSVPPAVQKAVDCAKALQNSPLELSFRNALEEA